MHSDKIYSVNELNNLARKYLHDVSAKGIWVKGEIVGYKLAEDGRYSGFTLCEKQEGSNNILAEVRVMCWGPQLEDIEQKLRSLDKSFSLRDGLIVQLKCSFDLWVKAGRYQIIAKDIEPSVTLGEIHLLRAKIFNELKALGLHEKNKKLEIPLCPIKVALISSRGCAGYNDFIKELSSSEYPFKIDFYHASMQGESVEAEVIEAIGMIDEKHGLYDVIAIVRGGGSELDLKWFDNKNIGISMANCQLPVLTGIGHEINLSVADMIAHSYFKTPTAVASFLVNKVREYERSLRILIENIQEGASTLIEENKREISEVIISIHDEAAQMAIDKKAEFYELIKDVASETRPMISSIKASFTSLKANMLKVLPIYIRNQKAALTHLDEKLRPYDPQRTIRLGYSITRDKKGKIIKKLGQVSEKDGIITNLNDGNILSVVAGKEGLNGK